MPDSSSTSKSFALQVASDGAQTTFDPTEWLARADAAGMRVSVVIQRDAAKCICFDGLSVLGDETHPLAELCRDGLVKERTTLLATHILACEPDRLCAGSAR